MIAEGTSAAIGPDGTVYYESDNHLVALSPTGVTTVGPALANAPNGSGGGIAGIDAVAGGLVWVSDPAGQGLDAQLMPYNATTLQAMGSYPGSVSEQIVDTSAGLWRSVAPAAPAPPPGQLGHLDQPCLPHFACRGTQRSDAGGLRRSTGRPVPRCGHRQRHHQRPRGGPALLRSPSSRRAQCRRRGGRGSACTMLRCWIGRVMAT